MTILEEWRNLAYEQRRDKKSLDMFWANYFSYEKGIYEQILENFGTPVKGTVKELADKFNVDTMIMTGFLDGINDSLKKQNPIDTMDLDTMVNLDYDKEILYKNMVDAKADWLYELPQWDKLIDKDRREVLYKEQKMAGTVIKEKKIGRNDPCPCGSGKKYKKCCGANK